MRVTDLGREHPITAGIEDFDLVTEQYWVLHDDLIDVLATTTHPTQAVASVASAGHLTGDLDPTVGCRAHRRDDPGTQPRRAGARGRPYRDREGDGVGDPHRVGVVGLGVISRAYLDTLADHPEVDIVAVADLDASRSAAVAATIPGAEAMSVERLLARPDVQTVLNLTIPAAHADISLDTVDAGKNVYGEKPLAVTFPDGRSIIDRAASAGVRVGCAPDTVLGTGTQTARAAIDGGLIGRPMSASAVMVTPGHERWHPNPDFYYAPGGGPLLDMGPYYISALDPPARAGPGGDRSRQSPARRARHRLGPPHRPADPGGRWTPTSPACSSTPTVRSPPSRRASTASGTTAAPIEVHGEAGTLAVPDPNYFDGEVRLFALGDTEWRALEPRAGYAEASRGIGLIDLVRADDRASPAR